MPCLPRSRLSDLTVSVDRPIMLATEVYTPEFRVGCLVVSVLLLPASILILYLRYAKQRCSVSDAQTWISICQILNDFGLVIVAILQGISSIGSDQDFDY